MRAPHQMDDDDPMVPPGPPTNRPRGETDEDRRAREDRGWHQVPGSPDGIEINDVTGRYRNNRRAPSACPDRPLA